MRQLAPVFPVQWITGEQHIAPHRIGCVGAQGLTHRCECEPSVALLSEDAAAGEQSHESIRRVWIRVDGRGDRIGGLRTVAERFDDAQLGRRINALRNPGRRNQVED
jgi:hypothetical protein